MVVGSLCSYHLYVVFSLFQRLPTKQKTTVKSKVVGGYKLQKHSAAYSASLIPPALQPLVEGFGFWEFVHSSPEYSRDM